MVFSPSKLYRRAAAEEVGADVVPDKTRREFWQAGCDTVILEY